jgi:hypothetical protein
VEDQLYNVLESDFVVMIVSLVVVVREIAMPLKSFLVVLFSIIIGIISQQSSESGEGYCICDFCISLSRGSGCQCHECSWFMA